MSTKLTNRDEEIRAVFGSALELIDSALVSQYRLAKEDATEVEQGLFEWFHRFSRRQGTPRSADSLRCHLLLMSCQAGHVYSEGKLAGAQPADEKLKRALTLGPQEIAIELEKKLKEKRKKKDKEAHDHKEIDS